MGEAEAAFFASGAKDAALLEALLAEHAPGGLAGLAGTDWLDFGAGVGRVARHLAPRCAPRTLYGVDIAASYRELLGTTMGARGVTNVLPLDLDQMQTLLMTP